jgi:hypothetical protein
MPKRVLLALAAAVLALLAAEGALSLGTGRSLRRWLRRDEAAAFRLPFDEERFAAAARAPGIYRVHPDPLVGYVLKAHGEFDILGGKGRADELGLRVRPAAPGVPAYDDPSALRVVVLGDSVAFGFGLGDGEVLAARLETVLNHARGPGARAIACRTVALPGWNYRNQIHFLRDHYDELEPELVVYLPIENDLANTRGVDETGQAWSGYDLAEEDPWLVVSPDLGHGLKSALLRRAQAAGHDLSLRDLGPDVLTADVSPESTLRFDAMARAVLELEGFLRRQGSRLVLVLYDRPAALPILCERLHRLGLEAPMVPFLIRPLVADSLGSDPHPSAETVRCLALVVARALFEHGVLERGQGLALADLPAELEARLAPPLTPELCAELAAASRAEVLESLGPAVDWSRGHGVLQVFGNVSPLGVVGARLLALLRGGGKAIRIALEALPDRPDLYPLAVEVEIGGRRMEPLWLEAGRSVERLYLLEAPDPRPIEVRLVPERWVVARRERRSILASFRLLALESLDG